MAIYNSNIEFEAQQSRTRLEYLIKNKKRFELRQIRKGKTLKQNNYMHLICAWFGLETGYTLKLVKEKFFKTLCNPEIFIIKTKGKLGEIEDLRSWADLNTKEATIAIERFRNWSNDEAGIYLPEASEAGYLEHIEAELSKYDSRVFI